MLSRCGATSSPDGCERGRATGSRIPWNGLHLCGFGWLDDHQQRFQRRYRRSRLESRYLGDRVSPWLGDRRSTHGSGRSPGAERLGDGVCRCRRTIARYRSCPTRRPDSRPWRLPLRGGYFRHNRNSHPRRPEQCECCLHPPGRFYSHHRRRRSRDSGEPGCPHQRRRPLQCLLAGRHFRDAWNLLCFPGKHSGVVFHHGEHPRNDDWPPVGT